MKNYSIVCKVTGTVLEEKIENFVEAIKILENYCLDDFNNDIEEVIKYCEHYKIGLLDYFINDHFYYYDDRMIPLERYDIFFKSEEIANISYVDIVTINYCNHWFYNKHYYPLFIIDDTYGKVRVIGWKHLKENINWEIVDEKEIVLSLLQKGSYEYQDFCDSFTIVIL